MSYMRRILVNQLQPAYPRDKPASRVGSDLNTYQKNLAASWLYVLYAASVSVAILAFKPGSPIATTLILTGRIHDPFRGLINPLLTIVWCDHANV